MSERFAVQPQRLVLAIDRTNWWKYNLLMVSLVWDRRALPVFWRLLNHQGNSSLPERRSVLLPVLKYFHDFAPQWSENVFAMKHFLVILFLVGIRNCRLWEDQISLV